MKALHLIPDPPRVASRIWLNDFARELMKLMPALSAPHALRCAHLAHAGTWLLMPDEAAQCWHSAMDTAARDIRRLPRDLLG